MRTPITISQTKFLEWLLTYKQNQMNNVEKLVASVTITNKGWVSKIAQRRLNSLRERFLSEYNIRKY